MFRYDAQQFLREQWGFGEERIVFADADAALAAIRSYFDWDASADIYPHRRPELEVWRYVLGPNALTTGCGPHCACAAK